MDRGENDAVIDSTFLDLETSLHRPEIRRSREAVARFLADELIEFGSSGVVYDKATALQELSKEQGHLRIDIEEFKTRHLAPHVVLVTYISVATDGNRSGRARRSSIWKLIDGRWQMIFHQGSRFAA